MGASQVRHFILTPGGDSDDKSFPDPKSWNKNLNVILSMLDYTFHVEAINIGKSVVLVFYSNENNKAAVQK